MNLEPRGLERNGRGCNLRKKVDVRLSIGKKKGAAASNNSKKEKIKENLENGNLNEAIHTYIHTYIYTFHRSLRVTRQ
jgi:hypothetical protein